MVKHILSFVGILAMIAAPSQALLLGLATGRPGMRELFAEPKVALRFFLATFVIMPALAISLGLFTSIPWPVWAGLALISITPPGTGLSAKALKLAGDSQIGLAWQALAVVLSIFTIPLTVFVAERILDLKLELGFAPVVQKILIFYVLPVAGGFLVHALWPGAGATIRKLLNPVSKGAQTLLLLLVLILAVPLLLKVGVVSILLVLGFVASAILIGHLLGGPPQELRPTLAAALATRWVAPALILARVNHSTREVAPVLLTYLIGGALLMMLYGRWVKKPWRQEERDEPIAA
jgi:bile acid:Na+ symporter, BASS family